MQMLHRYSYFKWSQR